MDITQDQLIAEIEKFKHDIKLLISQQILETHYRRYAERERDKYKKALEEILNSEALNAHYIASRALERGEMI